MYEIYYSPAFLRKLKKLVRKNPQLKHKITRTTKSLSQNPSRSSLKLHKLSGRNNWSVSVAPDIRIIVSIRGKVILCTDIGRHDDVY
jgi:mRNA-degrading endonuclease YafQ of YafQ-DinJ toxin-antitoxin module